MNNQSIGIKRTSRHTPKAEKSAVYVASQLSVCRLQTSSAPPRISKQLLLQHSVSQVFISTALPA